MNQPNWIKCLTNGSSDEFRRSLSEILFSLVCNSFWLTNKKNKNKQTNKTKYLVVVSRRMTKTFVGGGTRGIFHFVNIYILYISCVWFQMDKMEFLLVFITSFFPTSCLLFFSRPPPYLLVCVFLFSLSSFLHFTYDPDRPTFTNKSYYFPPLLPFSPGDFI